MYHFCIIAFFVLLTEHINSLFYFVTEFLAWICWYYTSLAYVFQDMVIVTRVRICIYHRNLITFAVMPRKRQSVGKRFQRIKREDFKFHYLTYLFPRVLITDKTLA